MAKKKVKEVELEIVGPGGDDDEREIEAVEDDDDEEESSSSEGSEDSDDDSGEEEPRKKVKKKVAAKDDEEEDGDEEDDARAGHGDNDEEDDADKRRRPRESHSQRRARQKKARERDETEIAFLRQRNENLERQFSGLENRVNQNETTQIDTRIQQLKSQLKVADQVLARAHDAVSREEATGDDIVEAQNIRDQLRDGLVRLEGAKTQMTKRQESGEPQVDSRLMFNARRWMTDHSWYDPNGRDDDSQAVGLIDNRLVEEGYDPRSPTYWDELSKRVKRRLPHRFKARGEEADDDSDDDSEERRPAKRRAGSGPRMASGGRERPLGRNQVYISAERKQALIDANAWDDPVLRTKYLKRYQQYDRDAAKNRGNR